jgi:hypothetical protein
MNYNRTTCENIYRQIVRYNRILEKYKADAMQEIAYSVLVGESEKESLRLAARKCSRMLRDFGWTRNGVRERYEAYIKSKNRVF